jgi:hypothetical protein
MMNLQIGWFLQREKKAADSGTSRLDGESQLVDQLRQKAGDICWSVTQQDIIMEDFQILFRTLIYLDFIPCDAMALFLLICLVIISLTVSIENGRINRSAQDWIGDHDIDPVCPFRECALFEGK